MSVAGDAVRGEERPGRPRPGPFLRLRRALSRVGYAEDSGKLGDFSTSTRVLAISVITVVIGVVGALVALALLRLIGFFTNVVFFGHLGTALVSPAGNHLGPFELLVPVIGALVIGLMARYGSERIRGHGIPEAIEAILISNSRVEPRVAVLKPVSAAISIGTGGPFGAEGPIIMTGGALGSMIAQFFHLTSAERKTLLVAGAAAGMSATFATPVAAVLLAVELLLFEWKPRSLVPVALASATAAAMRRYLIGAGPLFAVPQHSAVFGPEALLGCLLVGLLAGVLSALLTAAVYAAEDGFRLLPIHWMWWPAIGGVAIGLGGLIFPQALGVGYGTIGSLLQGNESARVILGILLVKSAIWAIALGSGTSGGVLAPLLMMGGALGGLEATFLPFEGAGFWPLISMGAILGGTMRSPFTGVIFALELTHDVNSLLPLLIAVVVAHGFTVLVMRRSILTEKVARRGYHLSREYAMDPLEVLAVREAMRTTVTALPAGALLSEVTQRLNPEDDGRGQHLFPVVDEGGAMVGVVTRHDLQTAITQARQDGRRHLRELVNREPIVAYPDEPLRAAMQRMAVTGRTRFPVVDRADQRRLVGMISLDDVLKGMARNLEGERRRERVLRMRLALPGRFSRPGSGRVPRRPSPTRV